MFYKRHEHEAADNVQHGNSTVSYASTVNTGTPKWLSIASTYRNSNVLVNSYLCQKQIYPPPPLTDIEHPTKPTFHPAQETLQQPAKTKTSPLGPSLQNAFHKPDSCITKIQSTKITRFQLPSPPTKGNSCLLNYRSALRVAVAFRLLAFVRGWQIWSCRSRSGFPRCYVLRTPGTADSKPRRRVFLEEACAFTWAVRFIVGVYLLLVKCPPPAAMKKYPFFSCDTYFLVCTCSRGRRVLSQQAISFLQ